jgi:hypothetical protein
MQAVFQTFMDGKPRPPGHEIRRYSSLKQAWHRIRACLNEAPSKNAG